MGSSVVDISARLSDRLALYVERNGTRPDELPITLDEWVLLAEWIWGPYAIRVVPVRFDGVPLTLVQEIQDRPDGSIVVWR